MSSVNKVILIARVGRDPETRFAPSGSAVVNISAATSRGWKDKATGEKHEETEWHRLVAYDRLAEVIGEYLRKGSLVYFEGRLKTRKWQDKEGRDVYTTEIVVDQMQMLGSRDGAAAAPDNSPRTTAPAGPARASAPATAPRPRPPAAAPAQSTSFDDMDDDIPF